MINRLHPVLFCIAFLAVLASIVSVVAQDNYPNRPITLTHGFIAGGNSDVVAFQPRPVFKQASLADVL